jgi:glycosidase
MSRPPAFEFHVSRAARDLYRFDEALFGVAGNVVFANLEASRTFAHRMNLERGAATRPERAVSPGALNAMGLIDEVLHLVVAVYREQRDRRALTDALAWFEGRLGRAALDRALLEFADRFPTVAVYRGRLTAASWLNGVAGDVPHRAVALEELMMLWLANLNPAFRPFRELFDDAGLAQATAYPGITGALRDFFETRPRFGPDEQNLVDLLRAPALASPESLEGQLAYIREKWAAFLGPMLARLLTGLDVLKEEELAVWLRFHPPVPAGMWPPPLGDSGAGAIPSFRGLEHEYERFSQDLDWMPRVVLIAKTVYVWLDQLSKRHGRAITRLDQIPDEELDTLARRGFTGLWLIGVWERSRASQRIKQACGNPEAVASAYSLLDYVVAQDLGGEAAFEALRERARARGLRLASDMVPNHMGIDSRWVIEHPDWFIQLDHSPYPAYRFDGPDLSSDGRVGIFVEDHYYDRSDAAVVFRRLDRWTGENRFVYHGNDGTSMPWNDTAQLDYRRADVREAVIQTILAVARRFPIIRFDAAMTLAKRHYQRLWFPEPGTGGAIPSRAGQGLTKGQFDDAIPQEFWREVVDRVAAEAPDTLLLAEAFWLMEGYFVRTLGMHRVYNSAFMNMLRDEENANYRSVIKNTLEFDPEVLKRYVNFMNNPDERTAVEQFGKGDKYFGICTLMATLPGLPMFGHGQVEGFAEKYGMEYRRAYHDEHPDPWLVARHEREISPLLHRRALFAEVRDFLLYDFFTPEGWVNEDVFAFSNRHGNDRALVLFHNRYATTRGWIRQSAAYATKEGEHRSLHRRALADALGFHADPALFVRYREASTGLEFLRSQKELGEQGFFCELEAYRCHVFLDWQDVRDDGTRPWAQLCAELSGRGVPSLDEALRELELRPVHEALRALLDPAAAAALAEAAPAAESPARASQVTVLLDQAERRAAALITAACHYGPPRLPAAVQDAARPWSGDARAAAALLRRRLEAALRLPALESRFTVPWPAEARAVLPTAGSPAARTAGIWGTLLGWCALESLGRACDPVEPARASVRLFEALRLREPMAEMLATLGLEGEERWRGAARVRAAFAHAVWAPGAAPVPARPAAAYAWLDDPDVAWLIDKHEFEGAHFFRKEPFERMTWWMALPALLAIAATPHPDVEAARALERTLTERLRVAEAAGWRVEAFLEPTEPPGRTRN